MTAYLNVGNTWDPKLVNNIAKFNKKSKDGVLIDTLYGCTTCNLIGNARSPDRLQQLDIEQTRKFVDLAHANGLKIAWTINESCVGNVEIFIEQWKQLADGIKKFFLALDIDMLVVAHPLIMRLLTEYRIDIPVEVSTITNITEPAQLIELTDAGVFVTRVCIPVGKNRDGTYLKAMVRICNILGIELEVIVNEFCFLNSCNCEGLYRRSCYDMNAHAEAGDKDSGYPRDICIEAREKDPVNWIRAKWVLPQHMCLYEDVGINRFKITGRTHPTNYLLSIIPHYMKRIFTGNLLELWPHLQTIGAADFQTQQEAVTDNINLSASQLGKLMVSGLLSCKSDCTSCNYCDKVFKILVYGTP